MFTVHVHVYPQLFRIPLWEFYFQSFAFKQTPARQIDTIGTVISTRRDGIENGLCAVNVLYTVCMYCTMFACTVQCLHVLYNVCMYCTMFACTVQCLHVLYNVCMYCTSVLFTCTGWYEQLLRAVHSMTSVEADTFAAVMRPKQAKTQYCTVCMQLQGYSDHVSMLPYNLGKR